MFIFFLFAYVLVIWSFAASGSGDEGEPVEEVAGIAREAETRNPGENVVKQSGTGQRWWTQIRLGSELKPEAGVVDSVGGLVVGFPSRAPADGVLEELSIRLPGQSCTICEKGACVKRAHFTTGPHFLQCGHDRKRGHKSMCQLYAHKSHVTKDTCYCVNFVHMNRKCETLAAGVKRLA